MDIQQISMNHNLAQLITGFKPFKSANMVQSQALSHQGLIYKK
jgi:hypothetical protein